MKPNLNIYGGKGTYFYYNKGGEKTYITKKEKNILIKKGANDKSKR